jgi:hypothetical protein
MERPTELLSNRTDFKLLSSCLEETGTRRITIRIKREATIFLTPFIIVF